MSFSTNFVIELDMAIHDSKLLSMKMTAYMILVAIDEVNVCNSGFTFLLIQQEHTETPTHEEIHDPTMLTGINGNDKTAPMLSLTSVIYAFGTLV